MDFFEVVEKRYSYRGEFLNIKPSREDLKKIVEAGMAALSGKNEQTTQFLIIDDEEKLNLIKESMPKVSVLKTAPAMIACIIDKEPEAIYLKYSFQLEDCAAATENMLLAIAALGYSSVWLDGILRRDDNYKEIGKILNIPDSKKVQILLPVGKEKEEGQRKEKLSFDKRACFNSYSL